MYAQMYWQLFLMVEVLPMLSQDNQNQSDIINISPSLSSSSSLTPSSLSPTKSAEDLNKNRVGNIVSPREFKGRFTITNIEYKTQYANVKSDEYRILKGSLETALDSALQNTVAGYIMCVVQWFNKGSVITDFVVFVSGNEKLTPDELQKDIFRASSSYGSLANFTLENIVIESQQSQRTDETEHTETPVIIELWKIITFGGLLVVFVLLVFILGLLMRNRLLKEALTRERRSTAELRHQQQRQQVETRAALSIVAASSTDELTTIVDNERKVKKYQSRSFSIGTSRSAERLLDVLRDRDHVTIQRNSSGKDALGGAYDQMQPLSRSKPVHQASTRGNKGQSKVCSGSDVISSVTSSVSMCEGGFATINSHMDDVTMSRDQLNSRKVSFEINQPSIVVSPPEESTLSPPNEEKEKDPSQEEEEEKEKVRDKPKLNEYKYTPAILHQVQAFEQGTLTSNGEEEMETNKTTKNEPKKLRHISLHATTSPQLKTSEEPRRREHEIRPLGGVVKRFTKIPSRPSTADKSATE